MKFRAAIPYIAVMLIAPIAHSGAQLLLVPTSHLDLVDIGQGYSSLSGFGLNACVQGEETAFTATDGAPKETSFRLRSLTSESSRKQATSLDLRASLGFGAYEASAAFSQKMLAQMSSYSETLEVLSEAFQKARRLKAATYAFTDTARKALADNGDFAALCGDYFVAGVVSGARFRGLYTIATRSSTEQQEVRGAFQASAFENEVSAKTSSMLRTAAELGRLEYAVQQVGLGNQATPGADPEAIKTFALSVNSFLTQNPGSAAPIYIALQSYDVIPRDAPPLGTRQGITLDKIARYIWDLSYLKASLAHIKDWYPESGVSDEFGRVSIKRIAERVKKLDAELARVRALASKCREKEKECPSDIAALEVERPPRRAQRVELSVTSDDEQTVAKVAADEVRVVECFGAYSQATRQPESLARISCEKGFHARVVPLDAGRAPSLKSNFEHPHIVKGPADLKVTTTDKKGHNSDNGPLKGQKLPYVIVYEPLSLQDLGELILSGAHVF